MQEKEKGRKKHTSGRNKFTEEIQNALIEMLQTGVFVKTACQYVNISTNAFYTWIQKGMKYIEDPVQYRQYKKYANFAKKAQKTIANTEKILVSNIIKASRRDWRAAAWFLEHRYSRQWNIAQDLNVNNNQKIDIKIIDAKEMKKIQKELKVKEVKSNEVNIGDLE